MQMNARKLLSAVGTVIAVHYAPPDRQIIRPRTWQGGRSEEGWSSTERAMNPNDQRKPDASMQTGDDSSQAAGSRSAESSGTSRRGFASMDESRQRAIASEGGRAAHARGTAHEFTSEEAREAGRKGGEAVSQNREHMAEIGRRGGEARGNAHRKAAAAARGETGGGEEEVRRPERQTNDRRESGAGMGAPGRRDL
jgi:general stress protein YciG